MAIRTRTCQISKEQSIARLQSKDMGAGGDRHAPIGTGARIDGSGTYDPARELYQADIDWTSVARLVDLEFVGRTTGEVHVRIGGSPRLTARRLSARFTQGTGGEGDWIETGGQTHWGQQSEAGSAVASPLLPTGSDKEVRFSLLALGLAWAPATVSNSNAAVNSTDPSTPPGAFRLASMDESSTARTTELATIRATAAYQRPRLVMTWDDNYAPLAPTVVDPDPTSDGPATADDTGIDAFMESTSGTDLVVLFGFVDPDPADRLGGMVVQVYDEFATDDGDGGATGSLIASVVVESLSETNGATVTSTGTNGWSVRKAGVLGARTAYRLRVRTSDDEGVWGPWSLLADGYFETAYKPGASLNPVMGTGPDSRTIASTLNSQDPSDALSAVEVRAWIANGDATTTYLDGLGKQDINGGTRSSITWNLPLPAGTVVNWQDRHFNRDGVAGDWSAVRTQTIRDQTGPTTMSPADASTKLLTRTPQFTIGNTSAFDAYRYRIYRSGAVIHDSGLITMASGTTATPTVPAVLSTGATLNWGDGQSGEMGWDAAIRPTGNVSLDAYSPILPFRVDALPSTALSVVSAAGSPPSVITPDADPVYYVPYNDLDRAAYGEAPVAREWEIRNAAVPIGSGTLVKYLTELSGMADLDQLGAGFVPAAESSYDLRARYRDDATEKYSSTMAASSSANATNVKLTSVTGLVVGDDLTLEPGTADEETRPITVVGTAGSGGTGVTVSPGFTLAHTNGDAAKVFHWGAWASWLRMKRSVPPTVAAVAPLDGAIITDPTPTLSHAYASASSKAQETRTLRVYERTAAGDALVYAITLPGTGTSDVLPRFLLAGGKTYAWEIEASDTDGLTGTTTRRTFETSFFVPEAPTGLSATTDPLSGSITLTWDPLS